MTIKVVQCPQQYSCAECGTMLTPYRGERDSLVVRYRHAEYPPYCKHKNKEFSEVLKVEFKDVSDTTEVIR